MAEVVPSPLSHPVKKLVPGPVIDKLTSVPFGTAPPVAVVTKVVTMVVALPSPLSQAMFWPGPIWMWAGAAVEVGVLVGVRVPAGVRVKVGVKVAVGRVSGRVM